MLLILYFVILFVPLLSPIGSRLSSCFSLFLARSDNAGVTNVTQQESLNEFILPDSPVLTSTEPPTSTLQNLLTNNYMPIKGN